MFAAIPRIVYNLTNVMELINHWSLVNPTSYHLKLAGH